MGCPHSKSRKVVLPIETSEKLYVPKHPDTLHPQEYIQTPYNLSGLEDNNWIK